MAQTEEFLFQNVAYRPTVYRTGMMVVLLTIFFYFQVSTAKANYAKSLRMLEEISESIHARRQLKRKINVLREPGVGAEFEMNENMADIGDYGFLFIS